MPKATATTARQHTIAAAMNDSDLCWMSAADLAAAIGCHVSRREPPELGAGREPGGDGPLGVARSGARLSPRDDLGSRRPHARRRRQVSGADLRPVHHAWL